MKQFERRSFLMGLAAVGAASSKTLMGANDRINLAIVGLGGRGTDHVKEYLQQPGCRIAGICDIDSARVERMESFILKESGSKPKTYRDMRQVFADKDIDAVSVVTCNHWHALAAIWACQAGKDVYTEKPASHNIWEGRKMVEAARKYGRMVQVGSQSRSLAHKREAMDLLHSGIIGKVYLAKGLCFKRRLSIGKKPDGPVPPGVDYDMWRGPAPMRPFNENRFHYNWHWFWDTGNGDIGNQGVHEMDIARWGLNKQTLPTKVISTGGKYVYDDDQETPNTQIATFDYGDAELVFEVRGLITGSEGNLPPDGVNTIGNLFFGSEGYMAVDVNGYQVYLGEKRELAKDVKFKEPKKWDTGPHMANFLAACRSRKYTDLNADIEVGYMSAALCHMANISYRTGRKLAFDPAKEKFIGDAEANKLVSRDYRKPYVVPEKV
jgi:predicted dehydrogenase